MSKSQFPRIVIPSDVALPAALPHALHLHQVALQEFIARVDGLANARAALEMLALLENVPRATERKAA